jgi:putative peptidoglycan lipid II flippase
MDKSDDLGATRRHVRAAIFVAVFSLFAKMMGALKEMAIAREFGRAEFVDSFQVAFSVTTLVPSILQSALVLVIVPPLARAGVGSEEKRTLSSIAMFVGVIAGAGCAGACLRFSSTIAHLSLPAGAEHSQQSLSVLLRQLAPIALATSVSGVFSVRLFAERSEWATILEAVPSVFVVSALAAKLGHASQTDFVSTIVFGHVLQCGALAVAANRSDRARIVPSLDALVEIGRVVSTLKPVAILLAGQALLATTTPIDQAFLSALPPGAVSAMGYATRLTSIPLALCTIVANRVALPLFATPVGSTRAVNAELVAFRVSQLFGLAGVATSVLLWMCASVVVRVTFQRGSFGTEDTAAVASWVQLLSMQIPAYAYGIVWVQFLAARGGYTAIALGALLNVLVKWMFMLAWPREGSAHAVALSNAAMYTFSCCYIIACARRRRAASSPEAENQSPAAKP